MALTKDKSMHASLNLRATLGDPGIVSRRLKFITPCNGNKIMKGINCYCPPGIWLVRQSVCFCMGDFLFAVRHVRQFTEQGKWSLKTRFEEEGDNRRRFAAAAYMDSSL